MGRDVNFLEIDVLSIIIISTSYIIHFINKFTIKKNQNVITALFKYFNQFKNSWGGGKSHKLNSYIHYQKREPFIFQKSCANSKISVSAQDDLLTSLKQEYNKKSCINKLC